MRLLHFVRNDTAFGRLRSNLLILLNEFNGYQIEDLSTLIAFIVFNDSLDMLKLDKPIEMEIDGDDVIAVTGCNKTANFKLSELKQKLIKLANSIKEDYEHSFACADNDNSCLFCGYKFYCPKWDE